MPVLQAGILPFLAGRHSISRVIHRAEGVKISRAKYMHEKKKQKMCEKWWSAHEDGKGRHEVIASFVATSSDPHFGCPRRDQCEYAHGFRELSEEGKALFLRNLEQKKKERERER